MEFMAAVLTHGKGFIIHWFMCLSVTEWELTFASVDSSTGPGYQAVQEMKGSFENRIASFPISAIKGLGRHWID